MKLRLTGLLLLAGIRVFGMPSGNEFLDLIGMPASHPPLAALIMEMEKGQHNESYEPSTYTYEINSYDLGITARFNQNFILSEINFYDSGYLYSAFKGKLPMSMEVRMNHGYFQERFRNFYTDTFNQFVMHGSFTNGDVVVYFRDRHIELVKFIANKSYVATQDHEHLAEWGFRLIPDGQCTEKGRCYTGSGTMVWPNGMRYTGQFQYGIPHGEGIITDSFGLTYSGTLKLGFLWDEGRLTVPNQYTYKGHFLMGRRYGEGEIRNSDGTSYTGEWENDLMSGKGKFTFSESYRYEGFFANNQFNGKGILYTKDGYLDGYFKNGKPHGYGTQVATLNNSTIKGKWVNGKKEGVFDVFNPGVGEYKAEFKDDIEIRRFREEGK